MAIDILAYAAGAIIQGLMEGQKTQNAMQTIKPELQAEVDGSGQGGLMDIVPVTPSIMSGGGGPGLGNVVDAYGAISGGSDTQQMGEDALGALGLRRPKPQVGPKPGGEKPSTSLLSLFGGK